jgi:hypothetical protein
VIGSQASLKHFTGTINTNNKQSATVKENTHTEKTLSTGGVSTKYTCTAKILKHFDYLGGLGAIETWQDLCVH